MRFMMDSLESEKAVREGALEEMKLCEECSKMDFEDVKKRLSDLDKSVTSVVGVLNPEDEKKKIADEKFNGVMDVFTKDAETRLAQVRNDVQFITEHVDKM